MSTYLNRSSLLITIVIIVISSFMIPTLTQALSVTLWATCKVWSPWYTKETKAEASVSWSHPAWIKDRIVVHAHHGHYSLHARVGANEPKKKENRLFYVLSGKPVRKGKKEKDSGHPRWAGDAWASSSISEYHNPDNWKFCGTDGQTSS